MEQLPNLIFGLWTGLSLLAFGIARRQKETGAMMLWVGLASLTLLFGLKDFLPSATRVEQVVVVVRPQLVVSITATPSTLMAVSNVDSKEGAANWQQLAALRPNIARWQTEIEAAATACGVDPMLVAAVMTQESKGDPNVCSNMGACGPMQLMPGTAREMNVADRFDPAQNILGGACYLGRMLDRYHQELDIGLAAYNAGPGNVDKYGGVPPFAETQKYVRNVRAFYAEYRKEQGQSQAQQVVHAQPAAQSGVLTTFASQPAAQSGVLTKFASPPVAGDYSISGGYSNAHPGLDIVDATTLLAVMDGTVHYVGPLYRSSDYDSRCLHIGCLGPFAIVLNHGGGTFTVYGHNSCSYVQAGDQVRAGQAIGCVGNEGRSTGDHVHFEFRINESWNGDPGWPWQGNYRSAINPTSYLP